MAEPHGERDLANGVPGPAARARPRDNRRALIILMYFALAVISSYFNDFEAVEMSALRQELANREEAGELLDGQSSLEIAATTRTIRQVEHEQAIQGTVRPPLRYRPLSFWMTELACRVTGVPYLFTDFYLRMIFLFFCAVALDGYLRRWLDLPTAALGVVVLFALMPTVYWRGYHKLYDFTNLLVFIAGYWLIRQRRDWWLVPLLVVGMFNRETTVMLVVVYFFVRWGQLPRRTLLVRTAGLGALCMGIYVGLRLAYGYESWYRWYELLENPFDPQTYLYPLLFFNAFWVLAFLGWKGKPRFLRRAMLMTPFFFAIHFVVGYVREVRLFLPLLPLFLPLGLLSLAGSPAGVAAGRSEAPARGPS